jgi:hypothetical protein
MMSLGGHQNSTSMFVGAASFLVVRLGLRYLALPATGVRGILTQEAIDHEQAVTIVALQRLGSRIQDIPTRYEL